MRKAANDTSAAKVLPTVSPQLPDTLKKIASGIAKAGPDLHGKSFVVLVSCGAYNPVHLMHLRAFYIARQVWCKSCPIDTLLPVYALLMDVFSSSRATPTTISLAA